VATDAVMQAVLNDKFTSVVVITVDTDAFINPDTVVAFSSVVAVAMAHDAGGLLRLGVAAVNIEAVVELQLVVDVGLNVVVFATVTVVGFVVLAMLFTYVKLKLMSFQ
jgi:hypothetical protein